MTNQGKLSAIILIGTLLFLTGSTQSPVFIVILGVGLVVNYLIHKQDVITVSPYAVAPTTSTFKPSTIKYKTMSNKELGSTLSWMHPDDHVSEPVNPTRSTTAIIKAIS